MEPHIQKYSQIFPPKSFLEISIDGVDLAVMFRLPSQGGLVRNCSLMG